MGQEADVIPGMQLPELTVSAEPLPDDGPVLIQLEYRIDADNRDAFLKAIQKVGPTRRRNGATSWRVFRDVGEDGRFVERYVIASWAEYVRLRARMTMADSRLQQRVAELQRAMSRSAYHVSLASPPRAAVSRGSRRIWPGRQLSNASPG